MFSDILYLRPRIVNILRLVWILLILWFEIGTFYHHVFSCSWPKHQASSHSISKDTEPVHVLLIADPQIPDQDSYRGRAQWLMWLTQRFIDLNLRKSWAATRTLSPDAIFFLGDMMDNGRMNMHDDVYEEYFGRFMDIFSTKKDIPVHYIPGNHDIGLGVADTFSPNIYERYKSHFGALNKVVDIGSHTFVLIDAPTLANEDYMRASAGATYVHWAAAEPGGTIEFLQGLSSRQFDKPTILLTHIPLARSEKASCGPLREKGSIRQGIGFGYQNTLSFSASKFLLDSIRPSVIFSGDDHDYCEFHHPIYNSNSSSPTGDVPTVKEITVKSFSFAMGIKRPGFQLLTLFPLPTFTTNQEQDQVEAGRTFQDTPCLLPNQYRIYLNIYIPFIIISLIVVFGYNIQKLLSRNRDSYAYARGHSKNDGNTFLYAPPTYGRNTRGEDWEGEWRATTPTTMDDHPPPVSDTNDMDGNHRLSRIHSSRPSNSLLQHPQYGLDHDDDEDEDSSEGDEDRYSLPLTSRPPDINRPNGRFSLSSFPKSTRNHHFSSSFVFLGRRRRISRPCPSPLAFASYLDHRFLLSLFFYDARHPSRRGLGGRSRTRRRGRGRGRGGFLGEFVRDIWRVIWPVLVVFGGITAWAFW